MNTTSRLAAGIVFAGLGLASAANAATVIFTDSFESPTNTQNWQVYYPSFGDPNADGWAVTGGTGIEIQRSGVTVQAHHGNQYVELDSDRNRGGSNTGGTNSSMTRTLSLGPGAYVLDWYYQPRTNGTNDNGISVYLAAESEPLTTTLLGTADGTRANSNGWSLISYSFALATEGTYALTFAAIGRENTLGGFIDSVTLSQVPLPGGALLMGSVAAAYGVLFRRRRSASS